MLRTYLKLSLVIILCATKQLTAQIINHSASFMPDVTCNGVTFSLTTANAYPDTNHKIINYWGDGSTSIVSILPYATTTTFSHFFNYPGTYTVKHVLSDNSDSVSFSYEHKACQLAHINSFYDDNNNCNFDSPTDFYITLPLTIKVDSANVTIDTIRVSGGFYYPMYGPVGTPYTFKVISTTPGTQINCPVNNTITYTVSNIVNAYPDESFSIGSAGTTGTFDLSENVTVRAGRHHAQANILVYNSYFNAQNALLTMNFSQKYVFISASNNPAANGNTLTWNLGLLPPMTSVNLTTDFEVPGPWLLPGDTVHSDYYLTPIAGDSNTLNNIIIHEDTICSSYDPNYIDVTPKGYITAGTKLNYTIEFENTGNAPANNISILDTLPNDLLPHTLDIVNSSAFMEFSLNRITSGAYVAKFDFPNINLLDSSHHDDCTGMVIFTINTKTGLAPGTYIPNRAGIYFDDNEVVMTNSATNMIGIPQSVNTMSNVTHTNLYPNPVADILTINTDVTVYNSVEISNTIGQIMLQQNITQNETKVNVKSLPAGIYFATLKGEGGSKTIKFEKL